MLRSKFVVNFGMTLAMVVALGVVAPQLVTAGQTESEVTFTKDIAPILQRSCQHCHQPDSVAPMPLITNEDERP